MMRMTITHLTWALFIAGASTIIFVTEGDAQTSRVATSSAATNASAHRLVVQVGANDPALMNLALNNISNVTEYYAEAGQQVDIELIAFGPGLHMLRDDTSPVKSRIKAMSEANPRLRFSACGNTRENMTRAEAKDVPLVSQARVVKAGAVRIMELQEQGWSYLRP